MQWLAHPEVPRDLAQIGSFIKGRDFYDDEGKFRVRSGKLVFGFGKYTERSLWAILFKAPQFLMWMLEVRCKLAVKLTGIVTACHVCTGPQGLSSLIKGISHCLGRSCT